MHYKRAIPAENQWRLISENCLKTSCTFILDLITYIDEMMRTLTQGSGNDEEEAWAVVMSAVGKLFEKYFLLSEEDRKKVLPVGSDCSERIVSPERVKRERCGEHDHEKGLFRTQLSEATCKEALSIILSPPVASSKIDQAIRTGFLETPTLSPEHVVILAESMPSWLAAADAWGAQTLSLYCENELKWYRENLDLISPILTYATVAGLVKGDWLKSNNEIL